MIPFKSKGIMNKNSGNLAIHITVEISEAMSSSSILRKPSEAIIESAFPCSIWSAS